MVTAKKYFKIIKVAFMDIEKVIYIDYLVSDQLKNVNNVMQNTTDSTLKRLSQKKYSNSITKQNLEEANQKH